MDTEMLIGATFEKGAEAEEAVLNPRTGATILSLPEASEAQIERAVAAAEKAFATWSRTTPAQRSAYLLRIADRIEAEAKEFLFIGQAVYSQQGTAGNIPLAAAFAVVPIVIMGVYLWGAKRMGAFDAL